jgi:multidrug efflux pump subunit AcrA (membrane-fusion protein)
MSIHYLVPLQDPRISSFKGIRKLRSARRAAKLILLLFVVFVVALAFVPWQQTAYGEGQVVAFSPSERQQRIDAPVDGWLEEWFVHEGSVVAEGDPIVRLSDNDPQLLSRLETEKQAVSARVRAAEQAQEVAQRNVRRQWQLFSQGLSSRKQYEDAQLKEADVLKELTAARAEVARLDTRLARQGRQIVRAPRAGVILRRAAGTASVYVKTGDPLAVLVPDTRERAVEIWLDGNDLPLIEKGRPTRLQFEGWPAIQFSGWPSLAVGTFGAEVGIIDAAGSGKHGKFRILVTPAPREPWPKAELLRQGVRAHGWVMLGTVPLGYELWRRFNNFPPSLPDMDADDWLETTADPSFAPPDKKKKGGGGAEKEDEKK